MHSTRPNKYAWKRFWCSPDKSFSLSDGGYLSDPESEYGAILNPSVRAFEQISSCPCLVLLGEPGIGKSEALNDQLQLIQQQIGRHRVLQLNLASYGSEQRLIDDLFKSQEILSWQSSTHTLHLFLDSLDECGLEIPNVATLLSREFAKYGSHFSRLMLRIACRTAEWPQLLTTTFSRLWGDEGVEIYELVPLRRKDVELAAKDSGISVKDFVSEVSRVAAEPFAIKPVTLRFLINVFLQNNQLPHSQADLYEKGCLILCEETNEERRSARHTGSLSAHERLRLAKRLAAYLLLCNKSAIEIGEETGIHEPDYIRINQMIDTSTNGQESHEFCSHDHLIESLGTGLFSSRGAKRMGFAHKTYAEYLAASYLSNCDLPSSERLKLICHPEDETGRIVPQLHEMTAWLAGMDRDVFRHTLDADPQVLVRSDVSEFDPPTRQLLLDRLLALSQEEQLSLRDWGERGHYHKLLHPNIAEQLRPYLRSRSKPQTVRRFAIEVAEGCKVSELQSELCEIAINRKEPYELRIVATYAVLRVADGVTQSRLKPLTCLHAHIDAELRLKTAALRGLWPTHLSVDELFQSLSVPPPHSSNSYGYFLAHELPGTLSEEHLPVALDWAAALNESESHEHHVEAFVAKISRFAWTHIRIPAIFEAMVRYAIARIELHLGLLPRQREDFDADEQRRRILVAGLLPRLSSFSQHAGALTYHPPRLVRSSDVTWLLERLDSENAPEIQQRWAQLIDDVLDVEDVQTLDLVLYAAENNAVLSSELADRVLPIALDSKKAESLRVSYQDSLQWQARMERLRDRPTLNPPARDRMQSELAAAEQGKQAAWLDATEWLRYDVNDVNLYPSFEMDITRFAGWYTLDQSLQQRFIQGAIAFLENVDSKGMAWIGTGSTPEIAYLGYRAFVLLCKLARDRLDSLTILVWERWAPVIVSYYRDENNECDREIAVACELKAFGVVAKCLRLIATRFKRPDGLFIVPHFLQLCWTDRIRTAICQIANDQTVHPAVNGSLLQHLVKHGCSEAAGIAESLITSTPNRLRGKARERALLAAQALITDASDAGWPIVWPIIRAYEKFGRTIIERVANKGRFDSTIVARITPQQAAELYVWLRNHYSPHRRKNSTTDRKEAIEEYRDGILRGIEGLGTSAAVEAIEYVQRELPKLTWIARVVVEAKRLYLERSWRAAFPEELSNMLRSSIVRIVRSGHELQLVVLESLDRLQAKLQGETPAAGFLWNEIKPGIFRPKPESDLSNFVKLHLEEDLKGRGTVPMRETEIRQGRGKSKGERTDIYVTCSTPESGNRTSEIYRLIIEVKGQWNTHVMTAMKTQLADRYLRDNACKHGLYLVGWYRCKQWDLSDSRPKKHKAATLDGLTLLLEKQAEVLSNGASSIRSLVLDVSLR